MYRFCQFAESKAASICFAQNLLGSFRGIPMAAGGIGAAWLRGRLSTLVCQGDDSPNHVQRHFVNEHVVGFIDFHHVIENLTLCEILPRLARPAAVSKR